MEQMEFQIKNQVYVLTDTVLTIYKKSLFGSKKLEGSVEIPQVEILYYHPEEKGLGLARHMYFALPGMDRPCICEALKEEFATLQQFYDALVTRGAAARPMSLKEACRTGHSQTEAKRAEERARDNARAAEQKALKKAQAQEAAVMQSRHDRLRAGCKPKQEEKYTCSRCGVVWFSNDGDVIRNFVNASNPNLFTLNQVKDLSKCPKCGSKATTHKKVKYWADKKGNCVDMEE